MKNFETSRNLFIDRIMNIKREEFMKIKNNSSIED